VVRSKREEGRRKKEEGRRKREEVFWGLPLSLLQNP
jgi:hypothetical protein